MSTGRIALFCGLSTGVSSGLKARSLNAAGPAPNRSSAPIVSYRSAERTALLIGADLSCLFVLWHADAATRNCPSRLGSRNVHRYIVLRDGPRDNRILNRGPQRQH